MSSALETIAAWPVGTAADKALQRTAVTKRFIWVFADTEDTRNFNVVDPADGTLPLYIEWNGILFKYDSTDTTTVHDGVTCAVTADSKRYKSIAAIPVPYSVLSTTTTAQPASPTINDVYYIPSAATGADWAGKDGKIGIYTARGWEFQTVSIGQFVYDESSDTYYHKNAGGSLVAGFGSQALSAGSVLPSNMSGGGGKVRWFVENQTTTTPPGSPGANVEYIVGSGATGAWASKDGQIARYENSAWVFYVPVAGWKAYDKSLGIDVSFNGTAWISTNGLWLKEKSIYTAGTNSVSSIQGTVPCPQDPTTVITTSNHRIEDQITIPYSAGATNNRLRITYRAGAVFVQETTGDVIGSDPRQYIQIAVFRDAETSAAAQEVHCWMVDQTLVYAHRKISAQFDLVAADTASHTYKIAITCTHFDAGTSDVRVHVSSLFRRTLAIAEAPPG